ncbi:MAG: peptidase MA family metallohydrolase [Chloroflexi bacterium]|nr:peptidase MA family metallohydrolase [Chloroflexota bacterium]
MRRLVFLLFTLSALLAAFQPVRAEQTDKIQVDDLGIFYQFGDYITFQARLILPSPASEVDIRFLADGEESTRVFPLTLDENGGTSFTYDVNQGPVRPFATVHYSYYAKLQDGQELVSEDLFFRYEDNRFPWQTLSDGGLTLHWYAGDLSFGQTALDAARRGVKRTTELLASTADNPIDIYVYTSSPDLQKALEIGGPTWVGGQASPDLRLALVAISPGPEQGLEMDREIPHELAHILTYGLIQGGYNLLPGWLREGIATQAELSANPVNAQALALAAEQKTIIPLADLCGAFPSESGNASLAYAESASFTSFLVDRYGQTGLLALISAYVDGLDCEQGAQNALGQPLSQMEIDWRVASLGQNIGATAFANLFPYLAILLVLIAVTLINAFTFKLAKHA